MTLSRLKRGDDCKIAVNVSLDGEGLNLAETELIEIYVGGVRKTYPGDVTFNEDDGKLYFPVSQKESFSFAGGDAVPVDVRVKFKGGCVLGADRTVYLPIFDTISEETL